MLNEPSYIKVSISLHNSYKFIHISYIFHTYFIQNNTYFVQIRVHYVLYSIQYITIMVDIMYTNSRSSSRYNANHPELKPGESFQTNISLKLLYKKDLTNCRVGRIAYDIDGNITSNAVPIFKLRTNEYKISNKEFIKQIVMFALDNDLLFTVESGGKIEIYLYTDLKVTITQEMVSIPSIAINKIAHLIKYIQSVP